MLSSMYGIQSHHHRALLIMLVFIQPDDQGSEPVGLFKICGETLKIYPGQFERVKLKERSIWTL